MTKIWTRQEALEALTNSAGDFKAGTCNENYNWYTKKNLLDLLQFINELTSFLDVYCVSFKFRMLCFKLNLNSAPLCYLCNESLRSPNFFTSCFRPTCENYFCRIKHRSKITQEMHETMSSDKKKEIAKKIGVGNSKSFDEKFGIEKSNFLKNQISSFLKGRKQTDEQKIKRIKTRKENNEKHKREWHTVDSKEKISISNKITHTSDEFRLKNKVSYQLSRFKQSKTMKSKIRNGEFTPNSNNWQRSVSFSIGINGEILRFRSKWEAVYYLVSLRNGIHLEYEKIRIPYVFEDNYRNYIVDFLSIQNKTIIEIRPKNRQTEKKEIAKFNAAKEWSKVNNFNFLLIDETWYKENWEIIQQTLNEHKEIKERISFKCPT